MADRFFESELSPKSVNNRRASEKTALFQTVFPLIHNGRLKLSVQTVDNLPVFSGVLKPFFNLWINLKLSFVF